MRYAGESLSLNRFIGVIKKEGGEEEAHLKLKMVAGSGE